ncbi:MAG: hypothetical protein J5759_02685 [Bacteroidales bacterium]|nr:hypothetical protein [Bacteroidales bacterium]
MKRLLLYILACILLTACYGIEKGSVKPTTFSVSINEVHGTSTTFTIYPGDENAWYAYTILSEYVSSSFSMSEEEIAKNELSYMLMSYNNYFVQQENNTARFSDIFCYQGTRDFTERFLIPDSSYRIVVFQIDPYKKVLLNRFCSVELKTKGTVYSDLSFDLSFSADTLRIIPSEPDATYFWDCEDTSNILDDYGDVNYYFRSLIYLYQDYQFIGNLLHTGTLEWVFSRDDKSIKDGDRRTIMVAGYADGELNTPITSVSIVYHKDSVEIIEDDYGNGDTGV